MEEEKLTNLGLTQNEAKIYLFLLKKGSSTTGPIIKETNIANSRVYESLNTLIQKGLVTYNIQKNGKHFQAANPNKLIDIEEERIKDIKQILPELEQLKNKEENEETTSAVFEGFEGFKTAFKKIIDECPVNGQIDIIGFSKQQHSSEALKIFLSNMNLKSEKKNQKLRFILDQSAKDWQGKEREFLKTNEVRYMPKGFISPAAVDITDDAVYTFLWDKKPYAFMIKNKTIAESYRQHFNFLWNNAEK